MDLYPTIGSLWARSSFFIIGKRSNIISRKAGGLINIEYTVAAEKKEKKWKVLSTIGGAIVNSFKLKGF